MYAIIHHPREIVHGYLISFLGKIRTANITNKKSVTGKYTMVLPVFIF